MIKKSEDRRELASPGVYFLFGYDENKERPQVYIGEAEDILKRLKQHLDKKDNWNEAIAFISKDENLNKAHIKYLEHRFYSIAKESSRYTVDNSNTPTKSSVSEPEQAELEEFIHNAKILINALGHKTFEKIADGQTEPSSDQTVFVLSAGDGKAYGVRTTDGFVLLSGSSIHETSSESLSNAIRRKVEQSRANGEIQNGILQNDKLFTSSSAAAAFAAGYSISGPQQWKTESGESLKVFETKANHN